MTIQLELWQLITLLLLFFGAVATFGKVLMVQFDKRLDERFRAQEKARAETQKHWDQQFSAIERAGRDEVIQWQRIERDFLEFKADLPVQYVRREDYVRNQTVIEAKLDAVALKIENLQLKGAR